MVSQRQGESWFAKAPELSDDGTHYIFTLADNDDDDTNNPTFKVPLYQGISISFTGIDDLNQPISIDGSKEIPYTVKGIADAKVTALPTADGWSATVSDGTITVTVTGSNAECDLLVTATDNAGNSVSYTLRLRPPYTYDGQRNYTVYTGKGLKAVADFINEDYRNNNDINIKLGCDIDLTGVDWKRIKGYYQGTFDGQGHRITGLSINMEGEEFASLFSDIGENGTVKNLQLEKVDYTGTDESYGIATNNLGTITACSVTGTLTASDYVAGIVYDNIGTITACWFNGTLSAPSSYGIARHNSKPSTVSNGGVISACCWGGNAEEGVDDDIQDPGTTTDVWKVYDGKWRLAIDRMNHTLSGNDYEWTLGTDDLPVLKKK